VPTTPNNCPCPTGYTLDSSGNNCVKTVTSAAVLSSTVYTVGPGIQNRNYGSQGTDFYADITNNVYPIIVDEPNNRFKDATGSILAVNNNVTNFFWGVYNASGPVPPYYGRLNACGVWTTIPQSISTNFESYPLKEWIGFSVCVNIPQTGTYCIGLGADNMCRFKLDGQLIVDLSFLESISGGMTWQFNKWHVFPITLQAGTHIISLEGWNYESDAAFGAEIYNATPAQLATIVTQSALTAVTVFSTFDKIGQTFQTGQSSGYVCPSDSCSLNTCTDVPMCVCLETIPLPSCCFKLTNCLSGAVIITSADLSGSIGAVVNIAEQQGCWKITSAATCDGAVPTITVTHTYGGSCNECLPCYILTNCSDRSQTLSTSTDLSTYVGGVVQIAGYPTICWNVTSSSNCKTLTPVQVVKSYVDCTTCLCISYLLTDCSGVNPSIITNTNLSAYLGKVIKIKSCANICWEVSCSGSSAGAVDIVLSQSFDTCDLCNPPIVCPSPELLHNRKVYPGYNTPGCSPEYTEEVNCEFAKQIFNIVKKRRYGITVCCDEDLQKYQIKKDLLDLRAIYDPQACVACPPKDCCPPCEVIPPVIPVPVPCSPSTDITATIVIITPCADDSGPVGATIVFNNPTR